MYWYIGYRFISKLCSYRYLSPSLHAKPIQLTDTQMLNSLFLYVARMQNTVKNFQLQHAELAICCCFLKCKFKDWRSWRLCPRCSCQFSVSLLLSPKAPGWLLTSVEGVGESLWMEDRLDQWERGDQP